MAVWPKDKYAYLRRSIGVVSAKRGQTIARYQYAERARYSTDVEKRFVEAAKSKEQDEMTDDIYSFDIKSVTDSYCTLWSAFCSTSTWLFYLPLFLIVLGVCLWPVIF